MADDESLRFDSLDDHTIYWVQRVARDVRDAEAFYRQIEAAASGHPFVVARELWRRVNDRRRWTRRLLLHVFGYDPQARRSFVRRHQERWPRVRERRGEWRSLGRLHSRDSVTVGCMLRAYSLAISENRDPSMDMVRAWLRDQQKIVADCADQMAPWNDELTREAAAVWVGGYVYAHLSLRNRRLRQALGPPPHWQRKRELAGHLPGAVCEAWAGGAARAEVASLPLEAARIVEGKAERKYRRRSRGPELNPTETSRILLDTGLDRDVVEWLYRCWGGTNPMLDAGGERHDGPADPTRGDAPALELFSAQEGASRTDVDDLAMAEYVRETMRKHALSKRQAQVAFLREEFPDWSYREIGGALGIKENSVKTHVHLARKKLKLRRSA